MAKTKTKKAPTRDKVRTNDTWDLSGLFTSDGAWQEAFEDLQGQIDGFAKFKGKLGASAKVLRDCCVFETEFDTQAERLSYYAFLKASEDVSNSTYQGMLGMYQHLATRAHEAASYIAPEIQAIPKATMAKFLKSRTLKDYKYAIEKLLRYKPYILSAKEERILAMQGQVSDTAGQVFEQLDNADLKFGTITNERGEKIELTHSTQRVLLESQSRAVRRKAFHQFYKTYEDHANTIAATLNGSVLQDVYGARVRNHASCLDAALFADDVPASVYDNLIETVHANFDVIHRYLDVRRKALGLRKLHFYDNYVPITKLGRVRVPYAKAAETVCEAMAPLGKSYVDVLRKGLTADRWVDKYANVGKRSGAFSAGSFLGAPYILMNYEDSTYDSMFTLAHEAGHSMHSWYCARHQPYQYYQYTIFVAEVASTFNEQLLNRHLLSKARDKKMRAYLINREIDEIRGTLIRQTMFAEFEKYIHEIAERGDPLTLDVFRAEYRKLLDAYFGPKTVIDDRLELEGLRIPHFYRAFYVYKYATGISAAIALSERVLNGGKAELDAYLNFLKSGGSKFPLEQLRAAGVDMEKPEPVEAALRRFGELVDELETLV